MRTWILASVLTAAVVGGWRSTLVGAVESDPVGDAARGGALYGMDCAVCHGPDGRGSFRGPDITTEGLASVDFQLRTGRMPLSPEENRRPPPNYDAQQIEDVLAYVSRFVTGPEIPQVDVANANLSNGQLLYELNCAACHQSVGSGGILANDVSVPSLTGSSPTEVVEAMRTGPGQMPRFGPDAFSDADARDLAAYVDYLHDPDDRGGLNLGHYGPVPEGLVAVAIGLGMAIGASRLLGTRSPAYTDTEPDTEPDTDRADGDAPRSPRGVASMRVDEPMSSRGADDDDAR